MGFSFNLKGHASCVRLSGEDYYCLNSLNHNSGNFIQNYMLSLS